MTITGDSVICLNGESRAVADGETVESLLRGVGADPRTVAVEVNGRLVRRPDFAETRLEDGDRVELVHFVQGG